MTAGSQSGRQSHSPTATPTNLMKRAHMRARMLVDGCVVTVGGADALSALGGAMGAVLDSPALSPDAISLPLSMITVARDLTYTNSMLIRLLVLAMMVSR